MALALPPEYPAAAVAIPAAPQLPDAAPAWLNALLAWAAAQDVTDVHLHPAEGEGHCWVRIDGELREVARYAAAVHARLVARLKVLGRCTDYAGEVVMESRFDLPTATPEAATPPCEIRLSIIPTLRGEKAVLRLTHSGGGVRRLEELGYDTALVATLRDALATPQGLILVTGPSGAGKSTTLYALLADLLARAGRPVSVVTVEDPIEQALPGAAQLAADAARGLDFAAAVRALLRQDSEVIMLGEIRDAETASVALQAALTGHRLLSTLHTLSAAEALLRLRQMGAAPYLIASAVAGILSCRLVRRACPACAVRVGDYVEAPGCPACLGSGHHGRRAAGGWSTLTPATSSSLERNAPVPELSSTLNEIHSLYAAVQYLAGTGEITLRELNAIPGLAAHCAERAMA